jgi:hypothetical protein
MRKTTKNVLKEKMTTRLTSTAAFKTHISNLRENFTISDIGGHPVSAAKKIDHLRVSLAGNVFIDKILVQYGFENKDDSMHTFDDIVAYIEDSLPNLEDAADVATRATANIMASEVYIALEAENKLLKSAQPDPKKRQGGKGKGKSKGKKKGGKDNEKTPTDKTTPKVEKYCYAYGTQHTHTSSEYKLMAADTTRFSNAMRHAKSPNHPPGGSVKVLGREPD